MRVSTAQIFDTGLFGIQRNQASLMKVQNQLATGRRVLAPEDDPVAAAQALEVSQSKGVNASYLDNQSTAKTQLNQTETVLTSIIDQLQNISDRAVQAGNGSLSTEQKGMIAQELKNRLNDLTALANTQDGAGNYIFAGFQAQTQPFQASSNTAPYSLTNQYMNYQGDIGQRKLQVSQSQEISTSISGAEAFMQVRDGNGNLTGRSMFDSVKNLVDILDPNSGVPFSQAAYDQSLNDVHATISNVSRVRSAVGSTLAEIDSLGAVAQDIGLQYDTRLSDLQDVDYASAISSLSRQMTQLQAAQKSYAQSSQLSLFSML